MNSSINLQEPEIDSPRKEDQNFESESTQIAFFDDKGTSVEQSIDVQDIQQETDLKDEKFVFYLKYFPKSELLLFLVFYKFN